MGYLPPLPAGTHVKLARGPGVHSDEASSAMPDLKQFLSYTARDHLQSVRTVNEDALRTNPMGDGDQEDEDEDEGTVIVPQDRLFPIAMLITGQWGPIHGEQDAEVLGTRRSLPVLGQKEPRKNPVRDSDRAPFFDRMRMLDARLKDLEVHATEQYKTKAALQPALDAAARAKGKKVPTRRVKKDDADLGANPWLAAIKLMRDAVSFVLKQESKSPASRTVFEKVGSKLLPFGQEWGVLADKGNKKLNFVAYSELPMVTCAGAGQCGVSYDYFDQKKAEEKRRKEGKAKRSLKVARDSANNVIYRKDKHGKLIPIVDAQTKKPILDASGNPKYEPEYVLDDAPPKEIKKGWCYSFKAFRYPGAYARLWRNTLASYADREFAILAHGGSPESFHVTRDKSGKKTYHSHLIERVQAAIRGSAMRKWPQHVKGLVLASTATQREAGNVRFLRLFVDGDINTEDNVMEWMQVCRDIAPEIKGKKNSRGRDIKKDEAGVEVYGYSKCWRQFVNVDEYYRAHKIAWPHNYVVNQSSGSIYVSESYMKIRGLMDVLPVSRGYFEAISIRAYLPLLKKQAEDFRDPEKAVPVRENTPWPFSPTRIRRFLEVYSVQSLEDLRKVVPAAAITKALQKLDARVRRTGPRAPNEKLREKLAEELEETIRKLAYTVLLEEHMRDPSFQKVLLRELALDRTPNAEGDVLAQSTAKQEEQLKRIINGAELLEASDKVTGRKGFYDKSLALALHEVIWSFDLGGSCPLVCSNCADTDGPGAVHRCAAKPTSPLWRRTIHIGLH